jgi:hypothetical protein
MRSDGPRTAATARVSYEDLDPKVRRRFLFRGLVRAAVSTILLVVLYYVLPLSGKIDTSATVGLVIGLLGFGTIATWQIRTIASSQYPRLRAVQAVATLIPLLLVLFASTYFLMARSNEVAFSQPLTRTDALYFTVTVFSTVGFGDIVPQAQSARVVTMVQMLADLITIGLVAHVILGAVQVGLRRRSGGPSASGGSQDG